MKHALIFSFMLLLICACGGSDGTTTGGDTDTSTSEVSTQNNSLDIEACISEEGRSLCEFLPMEIVEKYMPEGFEERSYQPKKRGIAADCSYTYQHPTKRVPMLGADFPALYIINLGDVDQGYASIFNNAYKTHTPEEVDKLKANLEAELDRKVAAGEMTEEERELSAGFGNALEGKFYVSVPGLGDAAAWGNADLSRASPTEGTLHILVGDTAFSIKVDTHESREASKEVALEVAEAVFAACK